MGEHITSHVSGFTVLPQRDHSGQVSFECQEELFRQEVENADDIRLSQRLVKKCMAEKKKFCNDVKPGAQSEIAPMACMLRRRRDGIQSSHPILPLHRPCVALICKIAIQ